MAGWKLRSVISGGQSGADQAGISAAKFLEYQTGGRCPKGWLTENGAEPWLREFGLLETSSPGYSSRTYANVLGSDGTVIFTPAVLTWGTKQERKTIARQETTKRAAARLAGRGDIVSDTDRLLEQYGLTPGSLHTARLCLAHHKVMLIDPKHEEDVRRWIYEEGIQILNVAGSRESGALGIFRWVYDFLVEALVPF